MRKVRLLSTFHRWEHESTESSHTVRPKTGMWTNWVMPDVGSYWLLYCCDGNFHDWSLYLWERILRILRLNQFETQWVTGCCHPTVAPRQTLVKTSLWDSLPQLSLQCAFAVRRRGRCSKVLSWVLPSRPSPRILGLWWATFTLTMQLFPFSHSSTIFPHNAVYFPMLMKMYEGTKCIPAGNYSPLEHGFTDGWNLIRQQRETQREQASHSAFPKCESPWPGNTVYFNLQRSTFILQYMTHTNIVLGAELRALCPLGWTDLPVILATWEAPHCCQPQL